ncbi:MAG: hypothetical protein WD003_01140, partial [Candidatus Paceibacterota bacterium]
RATGVAVHAEAQLPNFLLSQRRQAIYFAVIAFQKRGEGLKIAPCMRATGVAVHAEAQLPNFLLNQRRQEI